MQGSLVHEVRLVSFNPPTMTIALSERAPKTLPQDLEKLLKKKRSETWTIAISDEIGQPTLHEQRELVLEEKKKALIGTPLAKALMEAFPGTTLVKFDHE